MADLTMTVELRDIDRFRLFAWQLRQLGGEMSAESCPHGERLVAIVDRFMESGSVTEDRSDG